MSDSRYGQPVERHRSVGRPAQISREAIGQAALEEIDGLSSTKVAKRLGIGQSSLYRHVTDRIDLVRLGVEYGVSHIDWPRAEGTWREFVTASARTYWGFLRAHRGASKEIKMMRPQSVRLNNMQQVAMSYLLECGFTTEQAIITVDMVDQLTVDFALRHDLLESRGAHGRSVMEEQQVVVSALHDRKLARAEMQELKRDPEDQFLNRLSILLEGLEQAFAPRVQPNIAVAG